VGKLKWACTATDTGARIAAWIAMMSGILAIIGLILGGIGLYPALKDIARDWEGQLPQQHLDGI
jgi:hypothetical protein